MAPLPASAARSGPGTRARLALSNRACQKIGASCLSAVNKFRVVADAYSDQPAFLIPSSICSKSFNPNHGGR